LGGLYGNEDLGLKRASVGAFLEDTMLGIVANLGAIHI
jgi:hypothetical protein